MTNKNLERVGELEEGQGSGSFEDELEDARKGNENNDSGNPEDPAIFHVSN